MGTSEPESAEGLPVLEVVSAPAAAGPPAVEEYRPPQRWVLVPVLLFLATCLTTYQVGGVWYAVPLLTTLLAHEFGHFIQTVRYRVPASFPFFIPFRGSPLGTMGAVIVFHGNMRDRRALFDIAISGPLAGLVFAVAFSVIGLKLSGPPEPIASHEGRLEFGQSLLFSWLKYAQFGEIPPGWHVNLHPMADAGWVGLLLTALNLIPIGQLDGGHILYALLRKKAHIVAQLLVICAMFYMVVSSNWSYMLLVVLLAFFGVDHPPTADDRVPLGKGRVVLGWLTLLFIIIGFTPRPFVPVPALEIHDSRPEYVSSPMLPPVAAPQLVARSTPKSCVAAEAAPLRRQVRQVAIE